ncbi:MAG: hypothetical protein LBL52_02580 [Rickettsiales bacterium]|nr:hypothetical protein [Rickettsiales bacterium]
MRKAFAHFFVIAFLAVQMAAAAHIHMDDDAYHNDCELCHFISDTAAGAPSEVEAPVPVSRLAELAPIELEYFVADGCPHDYFSTAPPASI